MTFSAFLLLAVFAGLILAVGLQLLAASGHFPSAARRRNMNTRSAVVLLWLSLAVTLAALIAGVLIASDRLSWQGLIIVGGLALLAAPLVLQQFSDSFVDGRGALIAFAGGAVALALLLIFAAI
jgi:hypothetical protein